MVAYLLLFFSYPVITLFSGYLEIYSIAHLGLILFITLMIRLLKKPRRVDFFLFGLISSLCGLLYIGNIPLTVLWMIPLLFSIRREMSSGTRKIIHLMVSLSGFVLGVYGSCWIRAGKIMWSIEEIAKTIETRVLPLTKVRLDPSVQSWYLSAGEILSRDHLLEMVDIWMIYGVSGVFLLIISVVVAMQGSIEDKRFKFLSDGIFVSLLCINVTYLCFMSIKRFVLGFADWDLFIYIVYPINLCGVYCYCKWAANKRELKYGIEALKGFTVAWFVLTTSVMNPLWREINYFPKAKQPLITNYELNQRVRMTPLLRDIYDSLTPRKPDSVKDKKH
jgi:hypothetical protein